MPQPQPEEVPIDLYKAGLYAWTLKFPTGEVSGHIVVRGTAADQINGWEDYEQGKEYWYHGEVDSGSSSPATFTLTLLYERDPDDSTLEEAIAEVRENETLMGSANVVPAWTKGAPLGSTPILYTETDVQDGPGTYSQLYDEVTIQLPVSGSSVLMPTWYTSIKDLFSVFGGDPNTPAPIQEGITATFTRVAESDPGWPDDDTWYWYGRDPS